MVLECRRAPQLAFLGSRSAAFFARISYALYLIHGYVLILAFLANGYRPTILTWQGAALTICAFAAAVAISSASYLLIEGPLIGMAHRKFSFSEPKKVSKDLLTVVNV